MTSILTCTVKSPRIRSQSGMRILCKCKHITATTNNPRCALHPPPLSYLGISKILQQLGIIKPGFTKTAGTSIGALVQVMDHPGFPSHEHFLEQGRKLSADCLAERNCYQTLDRHLLTMIESIVPDNVTSILNDDMYVTMTRGSNTAPKGDFVHVFKDRQDVSRGEKGAGIPPARLCWWGAFTVPLPCTCVCVCVHAAASWCGSSVM